MEKVYIVGMVYDDFVGAGFEICYISDNKTKAIDFMSKHERKDLSVREYAVGREIKLFEEDYVETF